MANVEFPDFMAGVSGTLSTNTPPRFPDERSGQEYPEYPVTIKFKPL